MQQIDPKYLHFPAAKSHLLVYPWDNQIAILRYLSLARHTPAYILSPFNINMMSILILKITPLGGLTVFLETCKWHIGHEFLLKSSVLDELYKKTKHRTEISDFWMSYNSGTTQQKNLFQSHVVEQHKNYNMWLNHGYQSRWLKNCFV